MKNNKIIEFGNNMTLEIKEKYFSVFKKISFFKKEIFKSKYFFKLNEVKFKDWGEMKNQILVINNGLSTFMFGPDGEDFITKSYEHKAINPDELQLFTKQKAFFYKDQDTFYRKLVLDSGKEFYLNKDADHFEFPFNQYVIFLETGKLKLYDYEGNLKFVCPASVKYNVLSNKVIEFHCEQMVFSLPL